MGGLSELLYRLIRIRFTAVLNLLVLFCRYRCIRSFEVTNQIVCGECATKKSVNAKISTTFLWPASSAVPAAVQLKFSP